MAKPKVQWSRNAWQAAGDGLVHPDDTSGYVLPVTSQTRLGGMRVGDRLTVTANGTVSAVDQSYDDTLVFEAIATKQGTLISGTNIKTINGESVLGSGNIVVSGGGSYILPEATTTELGGVKVGARLSVTADGTLSAADQSYDDTTLMDLANSNAASIVDANVRINGKQDTLVSGTNVKTINGESIVGAGNITVAGGGDYILPEATPTVLGGVKVGTRLSVTPDGTLSAADQSFDATPVYDAIATKQDELDSGVNIKTINGVSVLGSGDIEIEPETYTLPEATDAELGGVKVGDRLSVTPDGTLSASDQSYDPTPLVNLIETKQDELVSGTNIKTINGENITGSGNVVIEGGGDYILPAASETTLGGVKAGARLSIEPDGTLNAADQSFDPTPVYDQIALKQNILVSGPGGNIKTINGETILGDGNIVIEGGGDYVLPAATTTTLGGVKAGARLSVTPDGTLSAADQSFDPTPVYNEIATKQDTLVSGTNIKTVNGQDILGSGNVTIEAGFVPDATAATAGVIQLGPSLGRNTSPGPVNVFPRSGPNALSTANGNQGLFLNADPDVFSQSTDVLELKLQGVDDAGTTIVNSGLKVFPTGNPFPFNTGGLAVDVDMDRGMSIVNSKVAVQVAPSMKFDNLGRVAVNGFEFGVSSTPAPARLFPYVAGKQRLVTGSATSAEISHPRLTSVVLSERVNGQVGVLQMEWNGTAGTGSALACIAEWTPNRTDLPFMGTARVTIGTADPILVSYLPDGGYNQLGVEGSVGWSSDSSYKLSAYSQSGSGGSPMSNGKLRLPLRVPANATSVKIEHFFFSPPDL